MDRYYQCHRNFDLWQEEKKHFVWRIKEKTTKTVINSNSVKPGSIVFYDAVVLLGTQGVNQPENEVRVVGYRVENKDYWVPQTVTTFQRSGCCNGLQAPLEHRDLLGGGSATSRSITLLQEASTL